MGTITDNDATPKLLVINNSVTETPGLPVNLVFVVMLTAPSAQDITVHYETSDGSATAGISGDYNSAIGDLFFKAGDTTKTITVAIQGDFFAELSETFSFNLSSATNALFSKASAIGTILDGKF